MGAQASLSSWDPEEGRALSRSLGQSDLPAAKWLHREAPQSSMAAQACV